MRGDLEMSFFENIGYGIFGTKRKFGVEIETSAHISKDRMKKCIEGVDQEHPVRVSEHAVKDYNNNWWSIKRDGSCSDKDYTYGFEVTSYVGSGIADIENIQKVVTALGKLGVKPNSNCSVHVHTEVNDFNPDKLSALVAYWMRMEAIIGEMVPAGRITGIFAKLLTTHHKWFSEKKQFDAAGFCRLIMPMPAHGEFHGWRDRDRRLALNITNYAHVYHNMADYRRNKANYRKTVELRLPEGSMDARTVGNWVKFMLQFVQCCKKLPFPEQLKSYSLEEVLMLLKLHAPDHMLILSRGLWNLKVWILERILKHSRDLKLRKEALTMLNYISQPYKTYDLDMKEEIVEVPIKEEAPARNARAIQDIEWPDFYERARGAAIAPPRARQRAYIHDIDL